MFGLETPTKHPDPDTFHQRMNTAREQVAAGDLAAASLTVEKALAAAGRGKHADRELEDQAIEARQQIRDARKPKKKKSKDKDDGDGGGWFIGIEF